MRKWRLFYCKQNSSVNDSSYLSGRKFRGDRICFFDVIRTVVKI